MATFGRGYDELRRGLGSFRTFGDSCGRSGVLGYRGGVAGGYKASVSRVLCGIAKVTGRFELCGATKMAGRFEPRCAIITGVACAQASGGIFCMGF